MSVSVACECGNSYELRDEFRGVAVQCPSCGRTLTAGEAPGPADRLFGRDFYLLRQKALTINEKYFVSDENGAPLLFVERPTHFVRQVLAMVGAVLLAIVAVPVLGATAALLGDAVGSLLVMFLPLLFLAILILTFMALSTLRHVSFHDGASATGAKVMEVLQDAKIQFPIRTFTVTDGQGAVLGRLSKNYLYNMFRKQWEIRGPNGRPLCIVREDSIILSLLRRLLGWMIGLGPLLRTNFIFQRFGSGVELGEFQRKATLLDRYVLDLQVDPARSLDRRLAVATAVMLDTGERR